MRNIEWPRERLDRFRTAALRSLVRHAARHSPWYAKRLAGVDLAHLTAGDLSPIPITTKEDLRTSFDAMVTVPEIRLELCEQQLSQAVDSSSRPALPYQVLRSGGTTGRPVTLVASRRELAFDAACFRRFPMRWRSRTRALSGRCLVAAISSLDPSFRSQQLAHASGPERRVHLGIDQPIPDLVERLNEVQPDVLHSYPSMVHRLVHEASTGRLRIRPKLIIPGAEPLLPEHQASVGEVWGCPVMDVWGASEVGILGVGSGFEQGLLLQEDHAIVELVDRRGQPVAAGERADRVYVTPLFRRTLPLLRYEISDQVTLDSEPAACGSSFHRARSVEYRRDDTFLYDEGRRAHPELFSRILSRQQQLLEYQVRQLERGAQILLVGPPELDTERLRRAIAAALEQVGIRQPEVQLRQVSRIPRTAAARKLRRFVPLAR